MTRVDLNADMGEGFGPWKMGDDAALLDIVTSANIACGFHAGDPDVMARSMRIAHQRGVGIGAHPGFADLQGFGRRRLRLSTEEMENMIAYQIGAAIGVARSVGANLRHVKLHGALSNMATESPEVARTCLQSVMRVDPALILVVLAATPLEQVARDLGAQVACEIFADRAYNDDASLVDRSLPGAVLKDASEAGARMVRMLREGAIITQSGKRVACQIDTICLHGDSPAAVEMAAAVRAALEADGVELCRFG